MSTSTLSRPADAAGFDVFCGIDVARKPHHVVALDTGGRRLVDRPLPNLEPELLALVTELEVHGRVLVVVDQPASIGALAVAVARSRGVAVAYLPGLSMRRIADLSPGRPRPTPATRTSSPTPDARCRTLCDGSAWRSAPPSSSRCSPGTTPTWPPRRPG